MFFNFVDFMFLPTCTEGQVLRLAQTFYLQASTTNVFLETKKMIIYPTEFVKNLHQVFIYEVNQRSSAKRGSCCENKWQQKSDNV